MIRSSTSGYIHCQFRVMPQGGCSKGQGTLRIRGPGPYAQHFARRGSRGDSSTRRLGVRAPPDCRRAVRLVQSGRKEPRPSPFRSCAETITTQGQSCSRSQATAVSCHVAHCDRGCRIPCHRIMMNCMMLHNRIAPKLSLVALNSIALPTTHICVEESLILHSDCVAQPMLE